MYEKAVIVHAPTRYEELIERFNSRAQAEFYINSYGGDFSSYEDEHKKFYECYEVVVKETENSLKVVDLARKYISNYLFSENELIIVVGQDGLVANTAKYAGNCPILGVNPDPTINDGVLLPFDKATFKKGLMKSIQGKNEIQEVVMAEARFNDGQRLLAFNDLFIGPAKHNSARYALTINGQTEIQSSSGIIVSTGAGTTGWLSSILNMVKGVQKFSGEYAECDYQLPEREEERMVFAVREPFVSKHSTAENCFGYIDKNNNMKIESSMPFGGIVFSDGIESDFVDFNSGTSVEIGIAPEKAKLIQR